MSLLTEAWFKGKKWIPHNWAQTPHLRFPFLRLNGIYTATDCIALLQDSVGSASPGCPRPRLRSRHDSPSPFQAPTGNSPKALYAPSASLAPLTPSLSCRMEALMATSSKMTLRLGDVVTPLIVSDGSNTLASLPVKPFRKYVQRAWNTFDVIKGWTGELPDMDVLADQMSTASFDAMPVPLKPKHDAPVKNVHVLVAPSVETPGTVDIVKFMTFTEAIGYKLLGTVCHGECLQLDLPEGWRSQ